MTSFVVSRAARDDLRKIWLYTADNWGDRQAEAYIATIESAFRRLASGDIKGRSAEKFRAGYFQAAVQSHFIFYTLTASGHVDVKRVLHQRMNLPARLRDN
jgi:toxin ParE1/3/4